MAGLYIHIPFCKQKCHYCNFFSLATKKYRTQIFDSLLKEIDLQKDYFEGEKLDTIYFGGGTPSLYPAEMLEQIISKASKVFGIEPGAEITVEANPDDVNKQWLTNLKESSIIRLSLGIQSFHDRDLSYLNRAHNAREAQDTIRMVRDFGFSNLSIDLIYGIPTLNDEQWLANINTAIELEIPHISAYALTVEPGTALDLFIRKGKYQNVDDHQAQVQFDLIMESLAKKGYEHYEISNFALPQQYARHNTAYWFGTKYLGIGPSAHSYNIKSRQWNVASMQKYIDGVQKGQLDFEKEILTKNQKINEYIMTSLRTMWGLDLGNLEQNFGTEYAKEVLENLINPAGRKEVLIQNNIATLTQKGKHFADGIASDLFF